MGGAVAVPLLNIDMCHTSCCGGTILDSPINNVQNVADPGEAPAAAVYPP